MANLLFICSGAIDRSPCAVSLFDNSKTYKAKYAGVGPLTETPVTKELVDWADLIICMEFEHKITLLELFEDAKKKDVKVLGISNDYLRFDPELERVLREKLKSFL